MQHNFRFPVLKVKMTNPNGDYIYLKTLPQVESKVKDNSKSGDELTWGIDLDVANEVVAISVKSVDYANSISVPTNFIYQIVDQSNGELPDMVYYIYNHYNATFIHP